MFTLRSLQPDDSHAVLRLNAAAVPAVAPLDAAELTRLMAISSLHLGVAGAGVDLAGYALVFSHDQRYDGEEFLALGRVLKAPFLYIDQIVVDPTLRAVGIGRGLYGALEQHARTLGASALCCEVNTSPPNPASLAFHQRMGFLRLEDMATGDGRTVALLRKDLPVRG